MTTAIQNDAQVMQIIRNSGIFGQMPAIPKPTLGEAADLPAPLSRPTQAQLASIDPVSSIIFRAGLAGFDHEKIADRARAWSPPARPPVSIIRSRPPLARANPVTPSATITTAPVGRDCLLLTIEAGGEAALAHLEEQLGQKFAADAGDRPYWFQRSTSAGTVRAFQVMSSQRAELRHAVGELGNSALLLSFGRADKSFIAAGPGAARGAKRGLPQLPPATSQALASWSHVRAKAAERG